MTSHSDPSNEAELTRQQQTAARLESVDFTQLRNAYTAFQQSSYIEAMQNESGLLASIKLNPEAHLAFYKNLLISSSDVTLMTIIDNRMPHAAIHAKLSTTKAQTAADLAQALEVPEDDIVKAMHSHYQNDVAAMHRDLLSLHNIFKIEGALAIQEAKARGITQKFIELPH